MLLRTLKQTGYQPTTREEIQKILKANKHSHLQSLDPTRYTITGLARDKYYIKCETKKEASQLIKDYEKITSRTFTLER